MPDLRSLSILSLSRARALLGQLTWDSPLAWRFVYSRHPLADLEGPEYLVGAPMREGDLASPEERARGRTLLVTGRVCDRRSGAPVAGAILDAWQASPVTGDYAWHDYALRGKFRADEDGRYAIRTVEPPVYRLPDGPSKLNEALGGIPHRVISAVSGVDIRRERPRHIHFTVSAPGYRALTTQIYFDPSREVTEHDMVNLFRRPRGDLQVELEPGAPEDGAELVARFDFPLEPRA
jgi:protocatechuate 3,4-dioxygenase beta subunit